MGRKRVGGYVADEAGNIVGGPSQNIRVYELDADNKSTDIPADLFIAQTGADEITNDGTFHPYSGQETEIRVEPLAADTLIQVKSTTNFQRGDVIRFFSGATIKQRTIKAITDADTLELTEAIGFAFPVGSKVGSQGGTGYWEAWVDDGKNYEWTVENDATGEEGERQPLYVKVEATAYQEEGGAVGSRTTVDYVGARVTVTDTGTKIQVAIPNPMTTQGDTTYGGASGAETRLPIGAAGTGYRVNAGGTAPEWSSSAMADEDLVKKWALIG